MDNLESRNIQSQRDLQESRDFAVWAENDREKRTPSLTAEQKKQLQNYLRLLAERNPEVYPEENTKR